MKIIFAGTPDFATKHLEIVLKSRHDVACVLTQPDRKSGRGKQVRPTPVKELALEKKISILQPSSLKTDEITDKLIDLNPDIILVVAYGLLIPKRILDIPSRGCINVHASILPRWRGASPMEYSILSGDKKVGISYMEMAEGLDEGPVYETHKSDLSSDDNLKGVETKLIQLSEASLNTFLDNIEKGNIRPQKQDQKEVTFAPKINKNLLQIDWQNETSTEVVRKVNALGSKYGTYTFLGKKRIKIYEAKECSSELSLNPGEIHLSEEGMVIFCSDGSSILTNNIQMQGKNIVTGKEFITGYGDLLGIHKNFKYATQ